MIILITGVPGSGKTLYAVGELLGRKFADRPLFVNGVPDLLLPHTPITDADVENIHIGGMPDAETGKPTVELVNAVIVVDEIQRLARPRAASLPAPAWIKWLEVHRHSGCDLVFITQHPNQIDAHIRRLVGRHIHVRRTWGLNSAVVYEWDSCNNNLAFKNATSKLWRYPKNIFTMYKSSEKHTKAGGRVPLIVWVMLATVLAFPFVGWNTLSRLLTRFSDSTTPTVTVSGAKLTQAGPGAKTDTGKAGPITRQQYIDQFEPRIEGVMHSAPAYDEFTKPKQVPLPAACIESKRASWVRMNGGPCGCYTQTGQRYETSQTMCARYVRNLEFFPFLEPSPASGAGGASTLVKNPPAPPPAPTTAPLALVGAPTDTVATTTHVDAAVLSFMAKRQSSK